MTKSKHQAQITTLEQENDSLKQQVQELTQQNKYLQAVADEYREVQTLFAQYPNITYMPIRHKQMQDTQNRIKAEQDQGRLDLEVKEEQERQEQYELDKELILKENQQIIKPFDIKRTDLKQQKETFVTAINQFFSTSHEEFKEYVRLSNRPEESPVQHIITIKEGSGAAPYFCDVYHSDPNVQHNFFTLGSLEKHIHNYEPKLHKEKALASRASIYQRSSEDSSRAISRGL